MPKANSNKPKRKKYGNRYPWIDWFSQYTFTLLRGSDYNCLTSGMEGMIRNRASEMGIRVSIRLHESGNGITVDVVNPINKTIFNEKEKDNKKSREIAND